MELGARMKGYEQVSDHSLVRRLPVIIRLDGVAFHSFTKKFKKPFDQQFFCAMGDTAYKLCGKIAGAQLAYYQSDEISILLTDFKTIKTEPWFGYRVNKLCSVAASMATAYFAEAWNYRFPNPMPLALFDCRAFNVPHSDVANYFIWRQNDATRNSIQGLGQAHFSHKELHKKSCNDIQEMLFQHKGINWNDCSTPQKRGACVFRQDGDAFAATGNRLTLTAASGWHHDENIPVFSQDRKYIEKYVIYDTPSGNF